MGPNALDLRTAMLKVEKIIERGKDRVQSRRNRQTKGKVSALKEEVAEDLCEWNTKLTPRTVGSCSPPRE